MTLLPLLAVGFLMNVVAVLFVLVCVVLILVILVQKGRGGGLSGAFGGGMASGLLGSKTGDFLTWVTIGLVTIFLGLAVLMARYYRPSVSEYGVEPEVPATQSAPAATEQPAPAPTDQSAPAAPATESQPAPATEAPAAQPPAQDAAAGGTGGQ
jgi:preprotein translocase subunit SecG